MGTGKAIKTVENSGGGMTQCIDSNKLDRVLNHIQNHDYYPEFVDKLTHLFFSTCQFHCFADGNKRIAITLSTEFLLKKYGFKVDKDKNRKQRYEFIRYEIEAYDTFLRKKYINSY